MTNSLAKPGAMVEDFPKAKPGVVSRKKVNRSWATETTYIEYDATIFLMNHALLCLKPVKYSINTFKISSADAPQLHKWGVWERELIAIEFVGKNQELPLR